MAYADPFYTPAIGLEPDDLLGAAPTSAEARSWEPPCWPSDDMAGPSVLNRGIGWRGLRLLSRAAKPGASRH